VAMHRAIGEREARMEAALATAEAASRAKGEFLANMSHEIRTPMNGVLGFTRLLLETSLNGEQREQVQTIRQSGDALMLIIDDILDATKIGAGELALENKPFNLSSTVEEAVGFFRPQAEKKKLKISLDMAADVPRELQGDAARVRQVLHNLVNNAIKFTARG